jgi:hypothetical protein
MTLFSHGGDVGGTKEDFSEEQQRCLRRVLESMSFSGPLMKVCCPDAGCVCDACQQNAALVLEYPFVASSHGRFRLCQRHLCELALDAPTVLEELVTSLVALVRAKERLEAA